MKKNLCSASIPDSQSLPGLTSLRCELPRGHAGDHRSVPKAARPARPEPGFKPREWYFDVEMRDGKITKITTSKKKIS